MPSLTRLLSNPHELISWEKLTQLLSICQNAKNRSLIPIYEKIYERMVQSNLAMADLQDLIALYEVSASSEFALHLPVLRCIKEACLEATLRKLGSAPIFVLTRVLKAFVKIPREINPLVGLACEGINRQTALFPIETVCTILQFCGKLRIIGSPLPEAILNRAVNQLPAVLSTSTMGKLSEIVAAMAVIRSNWPSAVGTALLGLRSSVPVGDWSCYAVVVVADGGQDYGPFLSDIRELEGQNDMWRVIRLACMYLLPVKAEITALIGRYEQELQENARKTGGLSLVPVLLHLENRYILPICRIFPTFLSSYISISLPSKAIPTSEQLRLLFLCSPHLPLPVLPALPTAQLLQFTKSLHYIRKAEDFLHFLAWVGPANLHIEVLARVLKWAEVGKRTSAGHMFRRMLNTAVGNVMECRVFNAFLETAFEIIEEDKTSCEIFLRNAVETVKSQLNADFAYLPLLEKLLETLPEASDIVPKVLELATSSSKYPEILVKLAAGRLDLFDDQLVAIKLQATGMEICDKITAVLLRGDKRLLNALETSLKAVVRDYPIHYLASFLPKLRKLPQADQFRMVILEEIKQKWAKEVLLPEICISVLEASCLLRLSPSDPMVISANEYLSARLQDLNADQVIEYMYVIAAFGLNIEGKEVERAVGVLNGTREVGVYGKYVLDVLYQLDLVATDVGKSVIRQYLETQEGLVVPIQAVFPLLRANSPRTDLISTISLSNCTLSQQILYHLLTNSLTPTLLSALLPANSAIRLSNSQLILPASNFTVCNAQLYGDWKWIAELLKLQGIQVVSEGTKYTVS